MHRLLAILLDIVSTDAAAQRSPGTSYTCAFHLMEQAVTELQFELNNMPERAAVPLAGMLDMLGQ